MGRDPETALKAAQELDEACAAVGREPGEIRRSIQLPFSGDPQEFADRLGRYHEAGFSELVVMLSGGNMPTAADPVRVADTVADKVLPALRALA